MSNAVANQDKIQSIRRRMLNGELSYEHAKAEAAPVIAAINDKAILLAKKHNLRVRKVSFSELMR